jgi:hypothetical protein
VRDHVDVYPVIISGRMLQAKLAPRGGLSRPHLAHRLVLEHLADSGPAIAEEHEPAPDHLRHAPEGAREGLGRIDQTE